MEQRGGITAERRERTARFVGSTVGRVALLAPPTCGLNMITATAGFNFRGGSQQAPWSAPAIATREKLDAFAIPSCTDELQRAHPEQALRWRDAFLLHGSE